MTGDRADRSTDADRPDTTPESGAGDAVDPGPVHVHLHHAMTGTYPLRVLDVLFCREHAVIAEYGYATPVDLLTGGHRRHADAFATTLEREGLAAALASARDVRTIPYEGLDAVHVFDGGWVGREKVRVEKADGPELAVRVHADLDVGAFTAAVESLLGEFAASVDRRSGLGFGGGRIGRLLGSR